jgi:uncharacterized protein YbaR (Trm112 family)
MKRLLMLALAATGAALWWRRQSGGQDESWQATAPADMTAAKAAEPPKLGGEVDPELLEILACPLDKQPVTRLGNYLVCSACQRHYPIRDGIPVMLIDEALTPEQAAAQSA